MLEAHVSKLIEWLVNCPTISLNPSRCSCHYAQNKNQVYPKHTSAGRSDAKADPDSKDEDTVKKDDEDAEQEAEDAEVCDIRYQLESLVCTRTYPNLNI